MFQLLLAKMETNKFNKRYFQFQIEQELGSHDRGWVRLAAARYSRTPGGSHPWRGRVKPTETARCAHLFCYFTDFAEAWLRKVCKITKPGC